MKGEWKIKKNCPTYGLELGQEGKGMAEAYISPFIQYQQQNSLGYYIIPSCNHFRIVNEDEPSTITFLNRIQVPFKYTRFYVHHLYKKQDSDLSLMDFNLWLKSTKSYCCFELAREPIILSQL